MGTLIPSLLIINYFQLLHINTVSLLLPCTNEDTKIRIVKELFKKGFTTSFSISSIDENAEFRSGVVADVGCEANFRILEEMTKRKLYSLDREWLLLEEVNGTSALQQTIGTKQYEKLYALPGSRVALAQISKKERKIALYDMYRIAMWTNMKYNLLSRHNIDEYVSIPARGERMNFEGVTLRAVTAVLIQELFVGFGSEEHNEADAFAKALIVVSYDIGYHLNFSMTLLVDNFYGYEDEHGNFTGLMGRFQREEIDIAATGIMMREERMKIVDFTGDNMQIKSPIIFKQPSLSTMTNIFLLPFTAVVWITCGVLILLAGLILYVSYYIAGKTTDISKKKDISGKEVMTVILGVICQQGPDPIYAVPAGRLILFLFELFIFSLFVAYSAKIVALLQSSTETIKTLPALANSPLSVGIQPFVYNKIFLRESNDNEIKEFYKKKIQPVEGSVYIEPEIGMEKVKSGLYAYKCETNWAYKVIFDSYGEREKCGLSELNLFLLPMLSIPVIKRSGIREHITRSVTRQRDVGLLKRAVLKTFKEKPECNMKGGFTIVRLIDFKPALEAMAIGVVLSLVVLCFEIIYKKRSSTLKRRKLGHRGKDVREMWF